MYKKYLKVLNEVIRWLCKRSVQELLPKLYITKNNVLSFQEYELYFLFNLTIVYKLIESFKIKKFSQNDMIW